MHYRTAQYRGKNSRISLVVQHFEVKGREVCFACLSDGEEWAEGLYHWFRGELLGKRSGILRGKADDIWRGLRKQLVLLEKEIIPYALAGVLCIGGEFFGFEWGGLQIYCLNTAFGRGHLEPLEERQEGNGQELIYYEGNLQPDVALLLTEQLPWENERMFSEGLFVGDMSEEWRMQAHLRELIREIGQDKKAESGAILLRSYGAEEKECREHFVRENTGESDAEELIGISCGYDAGPCGELVWGKALGKGAFSEVFCVKDIRTGKRYACKKSSRVAMLRREYCLGRRLEHPLFPKMYHFWQENDVGYLLMEYVPGCTVEQLLKRRGSFTVKQVIRLGMELADGLRYLHHLNIPHVFRDVKPENILVRQDGRVKLLDLGCAERMGGKASSKAGTPGYGAPEQFVSGGLLNETCDVYSVGKTLEAMLGTGRKESKLRSAVKEICKQCTGEEPSCRIPDMETLLLLLAGLQEECGNGLHLKCRRIKRICYDKNIRCLKNIWERSTENA